MINAGIAVRCFRERLDVVVVPLSWHLKAALVETDYCRYGCVIVGPVTLSATTYDKDGNYDGPALMLYCGFGGWRYEFRLVPLLWRLRRKPGFISVGPVKLYGYKRSATTPGMSIQGIW